MNKPALLLLAPTAMSIELWKSKFARTGWFDVPKYLNLDENSKNAIPPEVYEYLRKKYVNSLMLYPVCAKIMTKE